MNTLSESKSDIQKTESTFYSFFNHSNDGLVLVDSNGIIREWSSGYEQITGLSKVSVIGKMTLWDVAELAFPSEKRTKEECDMMKDDLKKIVAGMQQKKIIRHVRHIKTGEYRIFNVLYFPSNCPKKSCWEASAAILPMK